MSKLERDFQSSLIREIKERFPNCLVAKMDAGYIQGIPDLLVLYKSHWALLECKRDAKSRHQPNQDYYVEKANSMSFSAFIYPENQEEVLYAMERAFQAER